MSREQIKKMAKDLGDTWVIDLEGNPHDLSEVLMQCDIENIAEQLFQRNYRKQSEGKWIQESFKSKSGEILHHTPTCSICGEANSFKTKFCPNCGAKMKGESNER